MLRILSCLVIGNNIPAETVEVSPSLLNAFLYTGFTAVRLSNELLIPSWQNVDIHSVQLREHLKYRNF